VSDPGLALIQDLRAGGWIVRVTFTAAILCPILNVTCPVYVPAPRFALETFMETSWVALLFKLPPVGPTLSHFVPSSLLTDEIHEPGPPQSVIVSVWGAGSL
jgi:hypothetical protein